jgi:hypothetical protein
LQGPLPPTFFSFGGGYNITAVYKFSMIGENAGPHVQAAYLKLTAFLQEAQKTLLSSKGL